MFAGFDIGGTSARASLFNDDWSLVDTSRTRIRGETSPEEVARTATDLLEALVETAQPETIRSVGVGFAGQLDPAGRVVRNSPNLGWRDVPFAERLEDSLEASFGAVEIRLVNDLNASLWGEHEAGSLEGVDDAVAIFVGTGVGGALLADGELVRGASGVAGEIGHSKIEPGGRLCGCGERGCVEAYAGGIHLEHRVAELADDPEIRDRVGDPDDVDLSAADELARSNEEVAAIWQRATDGLAVVAANACTLLNPAALLVGGGVLEHCDYFCEQFLSKLTPLVLEVAREELQICRPELGDESGLRGAARLAARD